MKAPARFTKRSAKGVEFCSTPFTKYPRSEEHTSELQSRFDLVCRLLLEKKKKKHTTPPNNTILEALKESTPILINHSQSLAHYPASTHHLWLTPASLYPSLYLSATCTSI